MTGTEVDRVHTHGVTALEHFVVGRVLTAEQHPDADRLTVCTVDVGDGDPSQIVCGAPNVAAGQTVAVARPGAVMPDGTKLKKREAARRRVGRDDPRRGRGRDRHRPRRDHGARRRAAAGTPLADVLPIATDVLELEITPNRPDCLAIYGVAREVHAATGAPLAPPPWGGRSGLAGDVAGVESSRSRPDLCPRFTARRSRT